MANSQDYVNAYASLRFRQNISKMLDNGHDRNKELGEEITHQIAYLIDLKRPHNKITYGNMLVAPAVVGIVDLVKNHYHQFLSHDYTAYDLLHDLSHYIDARYKQERNELKKHLEDAKQHIKNMF